MPAHRVYVEPFLGRGVILNTKRPAAGNIGIDYDAGTIADYIRRRPQPNTSIVHGDAFAVLPVLTVKPDWLIYADPPYLTRSCARRYYKKELMTVAEHERLLTLLQALPCMVMISGYQNDLYSMRLCRPTWSVSTFWTVNRRGKRVQEFCWMNFPPPNLLHDTQFIGTDFTDRQRIKRKVARWTAKFSAMPAAERQAMLNRLLAVRTDGIDSDRSNKDGARDPIDKPGNGYEIPNSQFQL